MVNIIHCIGEINSLIARREMKLKKHIKALVLIMIGAALIFCFTIGVSQTIKAATWKKYTPLILRGHWYSLHKYNVMDSWIKYQCIFTRNHFNAGGINDIALDDQIHYRHKVNSRVYYIKGHEVVYSKGAQIDYYKIILEKSNVRNKKYRLKFRFLGSSHKHSAFAPYKQAYGEWLYR